jgi:hypothetical protein
MLATVHRCFPMDRNVLLEVIQESKLAKNRLGGHLIKSSVAADAVLNDPLTS